MSDLPTRRLRTKTSDPTDFFRGSTLGHHTLKDASSSTNNLEAPGGESTGLSKKIMSIPLFACLRKKSKHSTDSGSILTDHSSHPATVLNSSGPSPSPLSGTPPPPLPVAAKSPTIGSKLAAHFVHSRKSAISSQTKAALEPPVSTLSQIPISPRCSFESGSSRGSKNRSTTPRPRPTIVISVSPNNLEQFRDLFTCPYPLPGSSSQTTLDDEQNSEAGPPCQTSKHAYLTPRSHMGPPSRSRGHIPQLVETQAQPTIPQSLYAVPPTSTSNPIPLLTRPAPSKPDATPVNGISLNIDSASVEQSQEAPKAGNAQMQYDELSAYVRKFTASYAAEIAELELKVALMEREAMRREKEIAGLTWLVNNHDSKQPSSSWNS